MVPGNLADFLSPGVGARPTIGIYYYILIFESPNPQIPLEYNCWFLEIKLPIPPTSSPVMLNLPDPGRSVIGVFVITLKGSSRRCFVNLTNKFIKVDQL